MTSMKTNNANRPSMVRVFLRIRPLIKEEKSHDMVEYDIVDSESTNSLSGPYTLRVKTPKLKEAKNRVLNPAFQTDTTSHTVGPPKFLPQRDKWKAFSGFHNILDTDSTNSCVYETSIQPLLLPQIISKRQSLCIFTYGHTGSGKSHTLLGYEGKHSLGIYKYAVRDLLEKLHDCNKEIHSEDEQFCLNVRVIELYKENARDLLTGGACTIREDARRVATIRGPMEEDAEGRLEQKPLGKLCFGLQEVIDCVDTACEARRVGTSTHHDQSSRSHLILEMEVTTPAIFDMVKHLNQLEAQSTRLLWLQTECKIGRREGKVMPKWTEPYIASSMKLRSEIRQVEKTIREQKEKLKEARKFVGGTLVFCDLAGNEYARDAAGSTKEEMAEAAEINKSLLAIKGMIRSMNDNSSKHVSSRDSKLSMLLRRHIQGNKSGAIMIGHVSPSEEYFRKTINTLTYCAMVVRK